MGTDLGEAEGRVRMMDKEDGKGIPGGLGYTALEGKSGAPPTVLESSPT